MEDSRHVGGEGCGNVANLASELLTKQGGKKWRWKREKEGGSLPSQSGRCKGDEGIKEGKKKKTLRKRDQKLLQDIIR